MAEEKVTEQQAGDALRALVEQAHSDDEPSQVTIEQRIREAAPKAESEPEPEPAPVAAAPEPSAEPAAAEPEPVSDDLASLQKRIEESEKRAKEREELLDKRLKATQERFSQNERILRDKYLKKSSAADRALRTLKQTRTEQGVPENEVDRVISELEGSMNPQSSTFREYVPPAPEQEDQAIIVNSFLNEQGMTSDEAEEFGRWVRMEATTKLTPSEQAIAGRDLDGFMRIAHLRWQDEMKEATKQKTQQDTVSAVQAVQRVQREAARAAAAPVAPRKPPAAPKGEIDWSKMSEKEQRSTVSKLLKQSIEQYR